MIDHQFLTLTDISALDHVAEDVFDDVIDPIGTREFLSDPRPTLIVARDMNKGGLIIGFVSALTYFHPDKSVPEMFINEVSVAPDYRRQYIDGKRVHESTGTWVKICLVGDRPG